jgi:hypothetical protein
MVVQELKPEFESIYYASVKTILVYKWLVDALKNLPSKKCDEL